ncbi:MAG: hypothetical protein ACKOEC_17370 [Acidimicrobiia bacterium]
MLAIAAGAAWSVAAIRRPALATVACGAIVLGQAVACASIAPEHLAQLNALAGGPAAAYTKLVDSNLDWGQDLLRLRQWQSARGGAPIGLAYFGSAPVSAYDVRVADWRSLLAGAHRPGDTFVISATYLQGIFLCGDPFAALRAIAPSERIGYTLFAYALDRDEVAVALKDAARDPCAP